MTNHRFPPPLLEGCCHRHRRQPSKPTHLCEGEEVEVWLGHREHGQDVGWLAALVLGDVQHSCLCGCRQTIDGGGYVQLQDVAVREQQ